MLKVEGQPTTDILSQFAENCGGKLALTVTAHALLGLRLAWVWLTCSVLQFVKIPAIQNYPPF